MYIYEINVNINKLSKLAITLHFNYIYMYRHFVYKTHILEVKDCLLSKKCKMNEYILKYGGYKMHMVHLFQYMYKGYSNSIVLPIPPEIC